MFEPIQLKVEQRFAMTYATIYFAYPGWKEHWKDQVDGHEKLPRYLQTVITDVKRAICDV